MISAQAEGFHICALYFHTNSESLIFIIDKLLQFLSQLDGNDHTLSPQKRSVHQYLVKFGQLHGELLLPHFSSLLEKVKAITQLPVSTRIDEIFLMEFLTAITNARKNFQDQSQFIAGITRNFVSSLQSNEIQQLISNEATFAKLIAAQPNSPMLQQIFTAVNTVHKVATKSK